MALPFQNEYNLRTVAEAAAKACMVCLKPSTKVLITPNQKDFFYVCASHLQDSGFASPKVDPKLEAQKREREALQQEIELVKKEYEEKQKRKSKGKDDKKKQEETEAEAAKQKDDKIKALEAKAGPNPDTGSRVYILHKDFFQMRLKRLRDIEMAKHARERAQNPLTFPSAPTGDLS